MARLTGSRDADYAAKRAALVGRLRERLGSTNREHPSFRELATAAGVSEATLRHYFGGMTSLIAAVVEESAELGAPFLERMAQPVGGFEESVADAVFLASTGQQQPTVRALHAIGDAEGIRHGLVGQSYRLHLLDTIVNAVSRRLDEHIARKEMRDCDSHAAAIALISPVLFAYHHQHDLGGAEDTPLDIQQFLTTHIDGFVRGYRNIL
jgi:AcrR family transcriptional regulator